MGMARSQYGVLETQFELRIGTLTIGVAQHVLVTWIPDPCWLSTPSTTMHITATPNGIHEPTSTWANNPKMCVFRPPGAFPKHAVLLRRQAPFQQRHKIDTLPGSIFKQSHSGNEMIIFGKCHIPATKVRFGVFEMRAPLQFYNCRISAATRHFRDCHMKFEI